jgi:WD40 repeat protein
MTQVEEETNVRARVPDSPYVGLRDYTEADAELFFGRDDERKRIIGNLRAARLTLLYAESGVGKSSLLRAGVMPRLRHLAERSDGERNLARYVPVVFSSWSGEPTAALVDAIDDAITPFVGVEPDLPRDRLEDAIAAAASATDATLLIILDQFEELFLYHSRGSQDETFADQLARCINRPGLRANFLISIREDAYASIGDLLSGRVANVYGNYLHLEYLDRNAARDALVKPIERFNQLRSGEPPIFIAPDLVDAVLDQVRRGQVVRRDDEQVAESRPDREAATSVETTYLQLVAKRLWDEERAAGSRVLRLPTLERLGGAQTIIGTHLDHAMSELTADQQRVAATAYRFLVTSAGTKIALTVEDLAELSGLSVEALGPMLRRLAAADLHILRPVVLRDSPDRARFEIFHDALARPILDWRARYARAREDAELAAELEHERAERERAQEQALEAAKREAHERKRRRLAVAGLIIAIVALLASTIGFSVVRTRDANRTATDEKALRQAADSASLILDSSRTLGPSFVALAGLEASRLSSKSFAARNLVLGALQSNVAMPTIAVGHTRAVLALAFVSDSVLASGSADGSIRLWDSHGVPIGRPLSYGNGGVVSSVAVGSHSTRSLLAAGRGDGSVELWNVDDPQNPKAEKPLISVADAGGFIRAVAFSPDGKLVAVGGDDAQVVVWNVSDPATPQKLGSVGVRNTVRGLAFNAGATLLAAATDDGVAEIALPDFNGKDPKWLDSLPSRSVAFSSDGSLAYGVLNGSRWAVKVLDASEAQRLLLTTTDLVNSLAFTPDGTVLVSGGWDANVTTWDAKTGRAFGPPRTEEGNWPVNAVAVSPDGRSVAGGGGSNFAKVWPLVVSTPLATTIGTLGPVTGDYQWDQPTIVDLALGPDGQVAAAAGNGGAVVWPSDAAAWEGAKRPPPTKIALDGYTKAVAYKGDVLAVATNSSGSGIVTMWNTGSSCTTAPTPCRIGRQELSDDIWATTFDQSADRLAVGNASGDVALWDVSKPDAIKSIARWSVGKSAVTELAFSPTDNVLASGDKDGNVRLWNLKTGPPTAIGQPLEEHLGEVSALAFAPDGKRLASGGLDQKVVFWAVDTEASEPLQRLWEGHQSNSILSVAFSPSGIVAAGDGDGSTCMYDITRHHIIGNGVCLTEHYSTNNFTGILTLEFLPDGHLLSAGQDNPVVEWKPALWDEADPSVDAEVCRLAGRDLSADEWNLAFAGTTLENKRHATCPTP